MRRGTCTLPEAGWFCTRDEGHDGPCAAVPEDPRNDPILEMFLHHDAPAPIGRATNVLVRDDQIDVIAELFARPSPFTPFLGTPVRLTRWEAFKVRWFTLTYRLGMALDVLRGRHECWYD